MKKHPFIKDDKIAFMFVHVMLMSCHAHDGFVFHLWKKGDTLTISSDE